MSRRNRTQNSILIATTLSALLTPFMGSSVAVALPSIGHEFSLDAITLSWITTSQLLASAVFLVPVGRIADLYGRKRIFSHGLMLFTFASLLSAVSTSTIMLLCARILQGIGGAMIFGTSAAILSSAFPAGERGKVLGINVSAVYIGLSIGPVIGGFLTQHLGWRSIFYLNVLLGLFIIIVVYSQLKEEWIEAKGEKFDSPGAFLFGMAMLSLMFGLSRLPAMTGVVSFGLSMVFGLFFLWRELRIPSPVLDLRLFWNNRLFAFSNLAALINYCATSATMFFLSLYLQYIKAYAPQEAGMVLLSQPVVMAFFSPYAGRISDRIAPEKVATLGMVCTSIGLFLFAFLSEDTSIGYILISLVISGLGFALFSSPNTNAIMGSVERRHYGIASSSVALMRLTGQMLSMGIAAFVFSLVLHGVQIVPEVYPLFLESVKIAFVFFALLCAIGIIPSLARSKQRMKHQQR